MGELLSFLLLRAAEARPAHPAVEDERGVLTYRSLADRVGRLAAELAACGVHAGDRVGILVPKSSDAVCSLYAALWAGGAYVPLDVAVPVGRLEYMIRNCAMKALLTCTAQAARLVGHLAETVLERVVLVDDPSSTPPTTGRSIDRLGVPVVLWGEVAKRSPLGVPVPVSGNDLAYILYTSGSTGDPKGVMISHRNALAFVEWARLTLDIGPGDRLSSHAPFHFDLSVLDLYVAALAQATLALVPEGTSLFPVKLAEWIEEKRISVWYSVPSILVQLLNRGRLDRFKYSCVRRMLFAGEVFATKYLREWMRRLPHAQWYNLYGPTETNVCTYYHVPEPPEGDKPISIGRAASGDTILLRDDSGRVITEPGREGELWVDGPTVALGYWGDPQKTNDRFVAVPQITGNSRRLYRTGDLAAWDADGNLTFFGRRDHMIKSRGYRIELGEIESAAAGHPAVLEVCAVPIPDPEIGNRIRACVVPQSGAELDREAFERHLAGRLPRYMLPQEVFFLPQLPKTSTGKIDRRALAGEL
ncbi:MAG: amino acid adenylation domain-containing protein [Planctomycetota bacterium]